jgi:DNA adenine methylase
MPAATLVRFDPEEVVNVAAVAHLSPFRYPGGKTWLVPRIFQWLKSLNPQPWELAEPFAGGAIVSLSALCEGFARKIVLVEKDADVAAVWNVIVYGEGLRLSHEIPALDFSQDSVKALLSMEPRDEFERAFITLVRNRVQHGGILAAGASMVNKGENGRGIHSRWYPDTISKRIQNIVRMREDISFVQEDGIEFIRYNAHRRDTAFFIDPPYPGPGRRLYTHSQLDHRELFRVTQTTRGHFLMTYNNNAEILELAREFGFQTALIPMKNTHHKQMYELLVSRDLSWMASD